MEERPPMPPAEPPSSSFPPPPGPPPEPPPLPWEQPGLDFFSALFETVKLLITSPRKAFERMPVSSAIGRPLGFAILVGWPGVLAATLWEVALRGSMAELAPWADELSQVSAVGQIAVAMLAPLWLPIVIAIGAAIQHLFLMLVGGARRGFAATFRTACYAQISTLLGLLPMCGGVLGLVWHLVLMVIGLSASHRITTGRSALAVLLPLILCCGCIGLALVLGGAAWLAALRERG